MEGFVEMKRSGADLWILRRLNSVEMKRSGADLWILRRLNSVYIVPEIDLPKNIRLTDLVTVSNQF